MGVLVAPTAFHGVTSLPLTFMTSEAIAEILADFEKRLNDIPSLVLKCEDAVVICQCSSTSSTRFDKLDELAGARLSHTPRRREADAIAATTDEITQEEYANDARPALTTTAVLNPKTRTERFRTYSYLRIISPTSRRP
ncbi:hypothetical protein CYMTET_26080 [Cymbomonas tetramitiformis]|uniref:Uncharacterized protein n=1 Tax=Cymbomonas tetramitiformis TaxID=36881 RepID=A0AAE0KYJ2_9CHLO|nr:hypothetical protein CYMTET_26080 [Cymbomonas tetramitiformis]